MDSVQNYENYIEMLYVTAIKLKIKPGLFIAKIVTNILTCN
jgi:hypothetical protein